MFWLVITGQVTFSLLFTSGSFPEIRSFSGCILQVWAPAMDTYMPIKRVGHGGVTLLKWSPKGSKVFTACPSAMFRSLSN